VDGLVGKVLASMVLSAAKIRNVHLVDGFDVLGFRIDA
jgi:hypothetical protein